MDPKNIYVARDILSYIRPIHRNLVGWIEEYIELHNTDENFKKFREATNIGNEVGTDMTNLEANLKSVAGATAQLISDTEAFLLEQERISNGL